MKKVEEVLAKLASIAQELANVLDETSYELSDASPEYIKDADDFAYEVTCFVEDELELIKEAV